MIVRPLLKPLGFLLLILSVEAGSQSVSTNISSIQPQTIINKNVNQASISIKITDFSAREEKRPPVGTASEANRDIGFASVFLRIDNLKEENASLIIKSIQIKNVTTGNIQMATYSSQEVSLKPLENSEKAFHLTNKAGYTEQGQVKAIITYQIENQVVVIESSPIEVDRR